MRSTTQRRSVMCALIALSSSRAAAQGRPGCRATTLTDEGVAGAARWSDSLRALDVALTAVDRPWSCAGATVRVALDASGAVVVEALMPDGLALRRRIVRASELVDTVEGMLISDATLDAADPPRDAPAAAVPPIAPEEWEPPPRARPEPAEPAEPTEPAEPAEPAEPRPSRSEPSRTAVRLDVFADAMLRVASAPTYVTPGVRVGAGARFGRWGASVSVRFETLGAALSQAPSHFTVDTWVLALGAEWNARLGAGLLGVGPTLAIASCNVFVGEDVTELDDTIAQARVGASARWRARDRGLSFTAGVDGDVAFATLFGSQRDYDRALPAPPTWSVATFVGVSFGGAP